MATGRGRFGRMFPRLHAAHLSDDGIEALLPLLHGDEKLHRALEATYLRPAPTREAAAERLGLPFSTYRRHLTGGVERVASSLWERELHGTPPRR